MPGYYTSLKSFRALFEKGNPVITYHKLGPRPRKVRLKGLYLGEKLFKRQLAELRNEGFSSGRLESCAAQRTGKNIVITFDDGFENVLRHGLEPLAENQFQAIQFLVADRIGLSNQWDLEVGESAERLMDVAQIRQWLGAGHDIGSHTLTHPFLTRLPVSAAREEIASSKKKLEDLFGRAVEHFCYPYGDWNDAVADLVAAAGYITACTTASGINDSSTPPLALKRFTARYPSRSLKNVWSRLFGC